MRITPARRAWAEGGALFAGASATLLGQSTDGASLRADLAGVLGQAFVLVLCCVLAAYLAGLYDPRPGRRLRRLAMRLPLTAGLATLLLIACYTLLPHAKMPADAFEASILAVAALMLALRTIGDDVLHGSTAAERVLILGSGPLACALFDFIRARPQARAVVIGTVEETPGISDLPTLGTVDQLPEIVEAARPGRIIVALTERRGRLPSRHLLESRTHGVLIEEGVDAYERLTGKLAIDALNPSALVFAPGFRRHPIGVSLERALTVLVSLLALVCLAPLLALIALAIKLDSEGPVFFRQERLGQFGHPFALIKFRTMRPAGRRESEWVRDNGHRITRVGRWLRRYRLDELPQFVNALRGEMNLVGPRPHPVCNARLFLERIPYYSLRSMVPPGITGWAQVRYGYANSLEEETEKMRYDLYYIKRMSLWLDLRILLATARAMLRGPETPDIDRGQPWLHRSPPGAGFRKAA